MVPAERLALEPLAQELYRKSRAQRFGLSLSDFSAILADVARRYLPPGSDESAFEQLCRALQLEDLALSRACAAGNQLAWQEFISRYREKLRAAARAITSDTSRARELADSLYADLYGTRTRDGRRASKLAAYSGRGSLDAWLRTVLARQFVNEYRRSRRNVSLGTEGEGSEPARAPAAESTPAPDPRLAAATDEVLAALAPEDRYLLASWFLDGLTLARIAVLLGVHESTVSRRIARLVTDLRERILAGLERLGMSPRQAREALDVDVRDVPLDIRARLAQDSKGEAFPGKKPLPAEKVET